MLYTLVPYKVIRFLPGDLNQPLIGPETIVPSGVTFPPGWTVFPDVEFPPGWTLTDTPPEGVFPPPVFSPLLPESGGSAPLFVQLFEAGPPRPPGTLISPSSKTITIDCNGVEQLTSSGPDWNTARNYTTYVNHQIITIPNFEFIKVSMDEWGYNIIRTVFRFPLNELPIGANVVSGYFSIMLNLGDGQIACLQPAPNTIWESIDDYIDPGFYPDEIVTLGYDVNEFNLLPDSLAYIKEHAGDKCYFMSREYSYDFLDLSPGMDEIFVAEGYEPKLVLTYLK